jgi:AraC-like DNA-binding protein
VLYREAAPTGIASEMVKCFWMLEDDAPSSDVQRILPDGRCELILNFGESFESQGDGEWKPQPKWFVTGQITGPMLLRPRGKTRILGIRFHPHGAAQFLGVPIGELTDKTASVDELSRVATTQLEKLHDLLLTQQKFAALGTVVTTLASNGCKNDIQIAAAVRILEQACCAISIKQLAHHVNLSARQFERRFLAAVGIPPKMFCRMQRFQRVLRAMDDSSTSWVRTAVDCGYYDQAHLIRDFREFAGTAPTALLEEELHLARKFAK